MLPGLHMPGGIFVFHAPFIMRAFAAYSCTNTEFMRNGE